MELSDYVLQNFDGNMLYGEEKISGSNCSQTLDLNDIEILRWHADDAPSTRELVVASFFGVICCLGLLANIGLLVSLLIGGKRGATFKAPSTILIVNLAIADGLLLLTLPFAIDQRLKHIWRFGFYFCKIEESLKFLSYYGSIFFLTAMALDRFFTLYYATSYNRTSARKRLMIGSLYVWILAILATIPIMMFTRIDGRKYCSLDFPGTNNLDDSLENYGFETSVGKGGHPVICLDNMNTVTLDNSTNGEVVELLPDGETFYHEVYMDFTGLQENSAQGSTEAMQEHSWCQHIESDGIKIWIISNFVIGFVLPFLVICGCYMAIWRLKAHSVLQNNSEDHRSSSNRHNTESNSANSPSRNSRKSIVLSPRAKKLLDILIPCLILVFLICWLPFHVWHLAKLYGINVDEFTCDWVRDITFILAYSNSALNPILNALFLFNFKKSVSWLKKLTHFRRFSTNNATQFKPRSDNDQQTIPNGTVIFMTSIVDDNAQTAVENEKQLASTEQPSTAIHDV